MEPQQTAPKADQEPVETARERLLELMGMLKVPTTPDNPLFSFTGSDRALIVKALSLAWDKAQKPTMREVPHSSNVLCAGYNSTFGELWITFKDKGQGTSTYVYIEVPEETHTGMMAADSKGGYLASHIKGKFKFKRME